MTSDSPPSPSEQEHSPKWLVLLCCQPTSRKVLLVIGWLLAGGQTEHGPAVTALTAPLHVVWLLAKLSSVCPNSKASIHKLLLWPTNFKFLSISLGGGSCTISTEAQGPKLRDLQTAWDGLFCGNSSRWAPPALHRTVARTRWIIPSVWTSAK